jgi:hypothetical protein
MNTILWDDTEIKQYYVDDERKYRRGDFAFRSVTTSVSMLEKVDFSAWENRIGKEKAESIRNESALHGNAVHLAVECFLKSGGNINNAFEMFLPKVNRQWLLKSGVPKPLMEFENLLLPFKDFLGIVTPIAIEKRVFWCDGEVGFGGTADCFLEVAEGRLQLPDGSKVPGGLVVADWKNPRSKKEPKSFKWNKEPYYPLLRYALQLSAYSAGFNHLTGNRYELDSALLVCASPKATDIYYFSPESLAWHFEMLVEGLHALKDNQPFDWIEYEFLADEMGYLGCPVQVLP